MEDSGWSRSWVAPIHLPLLFFHLLVENGKNVYNPTTFRVVVASMWPVYFAAIMVGLCFRRKHFTDTVFVFLFLALAFRIINVIVNATQYDFAQNAHQAAHYLTRLLSFCFIYFSVGTSVLREPLKTLFYSLNLKQAALQNQTSVISWMIDQVPSICILMDDRGNVNHINKFGSSKLKLSPRSPLIHQDLFKFLQFESESKRGIAKKQVKEMVLDRNPNAYVIFTSQSTEVENNRVIEWTLKLVKSNMISSSSNSGTSSQNTTDLEQGSNAESELTRQTDSTLSILCLGRDITDEIEKEELLKEARSNAERLALMQENFVANTSHELRTPLNCIVGVTDLLMMQNRNEADGEMMQMIKTSANSLLALINDLLEFAKLKQGQMKLSYSPIRLRSFVKNCVESMSVLYEKSGIDLLYCICRDCPDVFENDENRLRQILFNLLSNAVKFTHKGQILLSVKVTGSDGSRRPSTTPYLKFTVQDSGVGISRDDMNNLFTRFFQAERSRAQRAGTGIGLSISKQLVELMGGSINVNSEIGVGTTFSFLIPIGNRRASKNQDSQAKEEEQLLLADSMQQYTEETHTVVIFLQNETVAAVLASNLHAEYGFQCISLNSEEKVNEYFEDLKNDTKVQRISLIVDLRLLPTVDESKLLKLQAKGMFVQIAMTVQHSSNCSAEMQSPRYSEFKMNLIRKPYNLARVANVLRISGGDALTETSRNTSTANSAGHVTPSESSENAIELADLAQQASAKLSKGLAPELLIEIKAMQKAQAPPVPLESQKSVKFSDEAPTFAPTIPTFSVAKSASSSSEEVQEVDGIPEPTNVTTQNGITPVANIEQTESPPPPHSTPIPDRKAEKAIEKVEEKVEQTLNILIVEDDKTNQRVLQLMLKRIPGVSYDMAENGAEGVAKFLALRDQDLVYDCIFMDSQMPVMDGSQATAEIRRTEDYDREEGKNRQRTYVTALTANALMDEKSQLFRTLVDDYLTKPITFKTFSDKLQWLKEQKKTDEQRNGHAKEGTDNGNHSNGNAPTLS
eukprot:TRINITY_DN3855_c1_g1_i3.p1 TRINITY_DN3855_c1_g1~~TRINITY_DN3855_c1_g1_i3.p1  ORF type:complete len:1026 (+),score=408.75 TRINITY_DN3855_c1_g1_i3:322-3399(+)